MTFYMRVTRNGWQIVLKVPEDQLQAVLDAAWKEFGNAA